MYRFIKFIACLLVIGSPFYFGVQYGEKSGKEKTMQEMMARVATPYVRVGTPTIKTITDKTRFIALVKPLNAVDVKREFPNHLRIGVESDLVENRSV